MVLMISNLYEKKIIIRKDSNPTSWKKIYFDLFKLLISSNYTWLIFYFHNPFVLNFLDQFGKSFYSNKQEVGVSTGRERGALL